MSYWVDLLNCQVRLVQGRYRTRVIESGEGFPLILLHGTGGHAENYIRNIPVLALPGSSALVDIRPRVKPVTARPRSI